MVKPRVEAVEGGSDAMAEKKYLQCEKCPYTSNHRGNLKRHMKSVHEKLRTHHCQECSYSASLRRDLETHVNIH